MNKLVRFHDFEHHPGVKSDGRSKVLCFFYTDRSSRYGGLKQWDGVVL